MAQREHGLETTIARCFAFVGPHLPLDAHFAIGNFIRDAIQGDPIKVKDGSPYRSYLYAADLAIWLWTILFKGQGCHPYNVGSDQEISIAGLAQIVASTLGGTVFPLSTLSINSNSAHFRYIPSTSRARQELGLTEWSDKEESVTKTAAWWRSVR